MKSPSRGLRRLGHLFETLWTGNSSSSLEMLGSVPGCRESCAFLSRLTQPHSPQAGGVEVAEALSHAESPCVNGDSDKGSQTFTC